MKIKEFIKEVSVIMPSFHTAFLRSMPTVIMKGKLTLPQMGILEFLRIKNECKMSELSQTLGVTKSAVTGLADRLIALGLVKRAHSEKDRRVVRICLTTRGANLVKEINAHKLKMMRDLFSGIGERDRLQYLQILKKLQRNLLKKKEASSA